MGNRAPLIPHQSQLLKIKLNPCSKPSYTALVAAEELDFATGYDKAETTFNAEYVEHDVSQLSKYTLRIFVDAKKGSCRALNSAARSVLSMTDLN